MSDFERVNALAAAREEEKSKTDAVSADESGESNSERLGDARKNSVSDKLDMAKNAMQISTPAGALSLVKQIDFLSDMPYVAAMGAALLKDLLDFVAGPTVVLSILFSALCSIFIFMMMLLVSAGGKKNQANAFVKKIGVLMGGGIADSIPGVDFFPIETLTVVAIYTLVLMERRNAQK